MVKSSSQAAKRPAPEQDAHTSSAERKFSLRYGALSVTVFSRPGKEGRESLFVIPERGYQDKDEQWTNTHILHEEDLLIMAELLTEAFRQLRSDRSDESKR